MSLVRSVLQSRSVASRVAATAQTQTPTGAFSQEGRGRREFWSTTPVQQETEEKETEEKERKQSTTMKNIVAVIAESHDLSLAESRRILNTVFDTITDSLVDKKAVRLHNFGTFDTYTAKAFTARNPITGASIAVPSKERCRFRPHETFKKHLTAEKTGDEKEIH